MKASLAPACSTPANAAWPPAARCWAVTNAAPTEASAAPAIRRGTWAGIRAANRLAYTEA